MARKTRSMKGEEVDFDLLDIKAKMQKVDKPLEVKTREDFVHMKRRRRGAARFDDLLKKATKKDDQKKSPSVDNPKKSVTTDSENKKVDDIKEDTPKRRTRRKIVKKDS